MLMIWQLPFMVDIHLFLPRPLQNVCPTGAPHPGDVYYGSIPQMQVDMYLEEAKNVIDASIDLVCVEILYLSIMYMYFLCIMYMC